jgi:hypothetical protein
MLVLRQPEGCQPNDTCQHQAYHESHQHHLQTGLGVAIVLPTP